jgi:ribosome-associated translation inhibitor RaiA
MGGDMADSRHSHQHPDYAQRIKALEKLVGKLGKQLNDVRRKLKTHHHAHTHSR